MKLYHYYNKGEKVFQTLSDLPEEEAELRQNCLKKKDNVYDRRDYDGRYLFYRRIVEKRMKEAFLIKGGSVQRTCPIYFILSDSHEHNIPVYREWFTNPAYTEIDCSCLDMKYISFTYGDSFIVNHPEYHDQAKYNERVLTYAELLNAIEEHGWPHDSVKPDDPFFVPIYIEAQVWCSLAQDKYVKAT